MILSDRDIRAKVKEGAIKIVPFREGSIQPASYDLHLDNCFKFFRPHSTEVIDPKKSVDANMEEICVPETGSFILHPGNFVLALIEEETGVSDELVGRLEGKSSLARLGLIIHTTAGFLDPGNSLKLTLELFNAGPLPIKLYPGMKIAQIAFENLSSKCETPYGSKKLNSKYFGDKKIGTSKMHLNYK